MHQDGELVEICPGLWALRGTAHLVAAAAATRFMSAVDRLASVRRAPLRLLHSSSSYPALGGASVVAAAAEAVLASAGEQRWCVHAQPVAAHKVAAYMVAAHMHHSVHVLTFSLHQILFLMPTSQPNPVITN